MDDTQEPISQHAVTFTVGNLQVGGTYSLDLGPPLREEFFFGEEAGWTRIVRVTSRFEDLYWRTQALTRRPISGHAIINSTA